MLDGHFKPTINRFWDFLARGLAALGLTPNQITWGGLALVALNCLLYLWHRDNLIFGLTLGVIFALDALDGAVARITNQSTRFGGYLDAVVDRYQEVLVYATLAWVYGWWDVAFLVITGSLLISYNKARTAVEIPIDNDRWPDLLERMERVIILCVLLALEPFINLPAPFEAGLLYWGLLLLGILTHLTAVQRFFRARRLITEQGEG